jgi:hypothetical protein
MTLSLAILSGRETEISRDEASIKSVAQKIRFTHNPKKGQASPISDEITKAAIKQFT